jgi:hypothetical protein
MGGPTLPAAPAAAPDAADQAVQAARLMERRKQLGLQGRMSTYLATSQQEGTSGQAGNAPSGVAVGAPKTLLGQ